MNMQVACSAHGAYFLRAYVDLQVELARAYFCVWFGRVPRAYSYFCWRTHIFARAARCWRAYVLVVLLARRVAAFEDSRRWDLEMKRPTPCHVIDSL